MSNRQLGWDEKRVKDRVGPSELAQDDKEQLRQHQSENENQPEDDGWIPPGNSGQGSRKD